MNMLYIYAHPNPDSYNGRLKTHTLSFIKTLQVAVEVSDLYAQHYNPVASWDDFLTKDKLPSQYLTAQAIAYKESALSADIKTELEKISWADHLLFQFPLWWFSVPAILKGWLDRELVKGFAYDASNTFDKGLLQGKSASLVVSTLSPESAFESAGTHKETLNTFLHPIHHSLRFVGIEVLPPFIAYAVAENNAQQEEKTFQDFQNYLQHIITHDLTNLSS